MERGRLGMGTVEPPWLLWHPRQRPYRCDLRGFQRIQAGSQDARFAALHVIPASQKSNPENVRRFIMTDILVTYGPHQSILFSAVLADVLDALGHRTSALPIDIRPLKPGWKIFGRAATLSAVPVQAEP